MPKLNLTLSSGDDEVDVPISPEEAKAIKAGFEGGNPFSFINAEGTWVWFNPDAFAGISVEED